MRKRERKQSITSIIQWDLGICALLLSLAAGAETSTQTTTLGQSQSGAVLSQSAAASSAAANSALASAAAAQTSVLHKKAASSTALKLKYSNYMNGPTFAEASGVSINHNMTLKYAMGADYSLSANLRFDSTWADATSVATIADSYLVLGTPTVKAAKIEISGQLWTVVGISEASRSADLKAVLQPRINMERAIGKWTLSNTLIPKFYVYGATKTAQKWGALGSYLNASYEIRKNWTLDLGIYPEFAFLRDQATAFNDLATYPGFTVNLNKSISLSPYIEVMAMNPQMKTTSAGAFLSAAIL